MGPGLCGIRGRTVITLASILRVAASKKYEQIDFKSKTASSSPAHNVAVNLLVDDPDISLQDALKLIKDHPDELYDQVTDQMVSPRDVAEALEELIPKPLSGGDIHVYHATDASTAKALLNRGFIPETKPRSRNSEFEYGPGKGLDGGLYVGYSPHAVSSYGRVTLEISIPKKFLSVPTELAQLGEKDPMKALHSHDGAVIHHRIHSDAFRKL